MGTKKYRCAAREKWQLSEQAPGGQLSRQAGGKQIEPLTYPDQVEAEYELQLWGQIHREGTALTPVHAAGKPKNPTAARGQRTGQLSGRS